VRLEVNRNQNQFRGETGPRNTVLSPVSESDAPLASDTSKVGKSLYVSSKAKISFKFKKRTLIMIKNEIVKSIVRDTWGLTETLLVSVVKRYVFSARGA
jgi:hypothetical protein